MIRPTHATPAGRAYLNLQHLARSRGGNASELMTMYVVERWLARLALSAFRDDFVLKRGMLLAGLGARRPTSDADTLMRNTSAGEDSVLARVVEIAALAMPEDGVIFDVTSARVHRIREEALYAGTRVRMDAFLSTAKVRFALDVNVGDPITPAPEWIELPALRPGMGPVVVLGYPVATVLAEKLCTAIGLGEVNTRIRDDADLWTLTADRWLDLLTVRRALRATAEFRGVPLERLSVAVGSLRQDRAAAYRAYRARLGPDGLALPASFTQVVDDVVAFADPLVADDGDSSARWDPVTRGWLPASEDD